MSGRVGRLFSWTALVALVSGATLAMPVNLARADDCRAAPNSPAPAGTHWYYRLEWTTQRKCWYVRAPARHTHHAIARRLAPALSAPSDSTTVADTPSPITPSPGDITPLPSPARTSASRAISAPPSGAAIDKTHQQSAQDDSVVPTAEIAEPEAGTSLIAGAQTAASPMGEPSDPAIAIASAKIQDSVATRTRVDVPADEAENSVRSGASANNAAIPMVVFPVLALWLALLGIGSRMLVQHAAARGAQAAAADEHRLDPANDKGWRGERGYPDRSEFAFEGQELNSLISAVSDQGALRADGDAVRVTREVSMRRYKLAHLRQHIERMLRSATGPYAGPLQGQTTA
jgi:hypothetical protein